MEKFDIYKEVAKRTDGDIYIGVVGPVRTGKSTFIAKFMEKLVLPNISNKLYKQIATDEMPQSADGKTIMTSQPKFVPANAVKIQLKNKVNANIRLVDCVGYFVEGALGSEEDGKPRLVKTPWSKEEIPFETAAEIGTRKVIDEYSTIGVLVTTDGSFGELSRESFIPVEERVVAELKALNKPFVIVLNTLDKNSPSAIALAEELEEKYGVPVIIVNATKMELDEVSEVLEKVLFEFPMQSFDIKLPKWMQALPEDNEIIQEITEKVRNCSQNIRKMKDYQCFCDSFTKDEKLNSAELDCVNLGDGTAVYSVTPNAELFYKVLSEECGEDILDDFDLISFVKESSIAKSEYSRLKSALDTAVSTGYGIVEPDIDGITIDKPILTKQSGGYGVKFKSSAPSLHIMKVDLLAEVSPIVGSVEQSEELISKLEKDYEEDPKKILTTNIFGKTVGELIEDGLKKKASNISAHTQGKMRKTVSRIINEGKGGVICILL